MSRTNAALLWVVSLTALALGCGQRSAGPTPSSSSSARPKTAASASSRIADDTAALAHARAVLARPRPFADRSEAVILADTLVLWARNRPKEQRSTGIAQAARVREKAYRIFHRATDAREAVELYAEADKTGGSQSQRCDWLLRAYLLDRELGVGVPENASRLTARLRTVCPKRWKRVKQVLGPAPHLSQVTRGTNPSHAVHGLDRIAMPSKSVATGPSVLEEVQTYPGKDAARVVLRLRAPASYSVGELEPDAQHPQRRLYLDLHQTKLARGVAKTVASSGLLQSVRIGPHAKSTRVVLDLAGPVHRRVFYLPSPFRVVVDVLTPQAATRFAAQTTHGPRPVRRVVLDPGHGGSDPGATGPSGLQEKFVTLDIAHRAAPVLANELGIVTMLTRDDDHYVSLEERTARANAFHADLFVSIHCNASPNMEATGIQTYVLDPSRDPSSWRVAARENSIQGSLHPEFAQVVQDMSFEGNHARSLHFAALLQRATLASLRSSYPEAKDGGVKSAAFFVLVGAQMPAVLFETSFISNPEEESRLATADYRQKLADGIVNAIKAYRQGL